MTATIDPQSPVHRLRQAGSATPHFILSNRDCAVLDFLWAWKVATTATIHAATGEGRTPCATYQALMRLAGFKLIQCQCERRTHFFYWELTKKGFQTIRESLGELKEHGFKSENVWHDLNVVAFHLGEWPSMPGAGVEFVTEQQMRRKDREYYPEWLPNYDHMHRSDGFLRLKSKKDGRAYLIALEVELSAKSTARYESVTGYYRQVLKIDLVLWLVGSSEVMTAIRNGMEKRRKPTDNFQQFVAYAEFRQKGWKAVLKNSRGEALSTIEEKMREINGEQPMIRPGTPQEGIVPVAHYDGRKALRPKQNPCGTPPARFLTV